MLVGLRNSSACCHDLKVLGFERSGAIGCSVVLCIDGLHVTTQVGLFIVWQRFEGSLCRTVLGSEEFDSFRHRERKIQVSDDRR
jgi:hypothetical protein